MCWKVQLDGVVIVADEVGRPHDIEGDDEQPKERPYPDSQKRQDGKQPGREVTVSGEVGETGRQIAGNARKDEDQPEEAKAVQGSDSALRFDPVHRLESWPDVHTEAEQPHDITQHEVHIKKGFR